jgi:hypothetical protein
MVQETHVPWRDHDGGEVAEGRDTSWAPSNRTLDEAAEARSSTDPHWDEALTARGHVLLGCGSS